ncbi:uncharacterized protein G2W53_035524 [Senna tora]|uniref:Uncharacterized protein n=1 Tax=Senna tora TaxID=362788 RepID=A0A834SSF0_9FABA|nr:uncharacterized protein G2W53_035524 [Senna tora]
MSNQEELPVWAEARVDDSSNDGRRRRRRRRRWRTEKSRIALSPTLSIGGVRPCFSSFSLFDFVFTEAFSLIRFSSHPVPRCTQISTNK